MEEKIKSIEEDLNELDKYLEKLKMEEKKLQKENLRQQMLLEELKKIKENMQ